ncbi:amino acid ABC transporter permease [Arthrobacter pigmenti]
MLTEFGIENFEPIIRGAQLTLFLCAASGVIASILGVILGVARTSPSKIARGASGAYINFVRGQPILIILFFMYFVMPLIFPAATFSRALTAIVGLSIYGAAYIGEIFRGSVQAIPKGQREAAEALGMHYFNRSWYVILPQAMKIAVPSWFGFLISLIKASSLVSVIGYVELTRAGRIVSTINQEPLTTFLIVAAFYFIISYPLSLLGRWYERRLA